MKKCQDELFRVTGLLHYFEISFGSNNSTYRLTKSMVDCISKRFHHLRLTQDTLDELTLTLLLT